jgi:hypothetical protein
MSYFICKPPNSRRLSRVRSPDPLTMVAVAPRDLARCWKVRVQTMPTGLRAGRQQSAFAPHWLWRSEQSVRKPRTVSSRMIRQGRSGRCEMTWIFFCRIGDWRLRGGAVITRARTLPALGSSSRRNQYDTRRGLREERKGAIVSAAAAM